MSQPTPPAAVSLAQLLVPPEVKQGVSEFVDEVLRLYGDELVTITAFGSAVSGDYEAGESDVNLFVVHASLDIEDLDNVSALSRRWLQRQMLAPRFLSLRNFDDFVRHFQVDLLALRDASAVLWGRDLLASAEMRRDELRWQSIYEIKSMRLRIKQQFWRVADDPDAMRRVMLQRFTSLAHLMRAALALRGFPAPSKRADVLASAVAHLGLDAGFVATMARLRHDHVAPDRDTLVGLFGGLLEVVRLVDAATEVPHP